MNRIVGAGVGIGKVAEEAGSETQAKVVRDGRYIRFQMAEVAVSRRTFDPILNNISRLRALPAWA